MSIVSNPLPLPVPREVGRDGDAGAARRLWDAVAACVSFIRALVGGRVFEWHEDEMIDTSLAPIKHNLRRRPWGAVIVRNSDNRITLYYYDQWDENAIVLGTGAGSTIVSFILF